MLSDLLNVVMWPKWVDKHLQGVTKNVFSWEKFYIDFLILLTENIFTDFEDDDFNCTGKFCCREENFHNTEAATEGALKIQIKVSQNLPEKTYASVYFLIKLEG